MSELWISRFMPPRPGETPVSCVVCGCRLTATEEDGRAGWRHLPSLDAGRDARGCRPTCVGDLHDSYGYALMETTATAAAA